MILNGEAVILRYLTEIGNCWGGANYVSDWKDLYYRHQKCSPKNLLGNIWFMVIFSENITKRCVKERYRHSTTTMRLVQYHAAISASWAFVLKLIRLILCYAFLLPLTFSNHRGICLLRDRVNE